MSRKQRRNRRFEISNQEVIRANNRLIERLKRSISNLKRRYSEAGKSETIYIRIISAKMEILSSQLNDALLMFEGYMELLGGALDEIGEKYTLFEKFEKKLREMENQLSKLEEEFITRQKETDSIIQSNKETERR